MALVLILNNRLQLKYKVDPDHFIDRLADHDFLEIKDGETYIKAENLLQALEEISFAVCVKIPRDLYNDRGEVVKHMKLVTFAPHDITVIRQSKPPSMFSSSGK